MDILQADLRVLRINDFLRSETIGKQIKHH
jgi:hypothetical protein